MTKFKFVFVVLAFGLAQNAFSQQENSSRLHSHVLTFTPTQEHRDLCALNLVKSARSMNVQNLKKLNDIHPNVSAYTFEVMGPGNGVFSYGWAVVRFATTVDTVMEQIDGIYCEFDSTREFKRPLVIRSQDSKEIFYLFNFQ